MTSGQSHNRSDATLRKLNSDLEAKATSMYIQAANKRASDPKDAAAICRQITNMVPKSSDSHQRAKQLLDEL